MSCGLIVMPPRNTLRSLKSPFHWKPPLISQYKITLSTDFLILTAVACTHSIVVVCDMFCPSRYLQKSIGYRTCSPPVNVNGACKVASVLTPSCTLNDPLPNNGSILVPDALHTTPQNIESCPIPSFLIPIPRSLLPNFFQFCWTHDLPVISHHFQTVYLYVKSYIYTFLYKVGGLTSPGA
jgi:hypothetical protein